MAKEKTENAAQDMEALVEYMAPVMPDKLDQSIFAQVNGESIRIKRGEAVKIKRKFVEVLNNAAKQEMNAYAYMRTAREASGKSAADL